jgi:uncharacterized protein (TIGR04255 family)
MNQDSTDYKYEKNFLSRVIFRVDFPKILDLDLKEPTAEFQKNIIEKYPKVKERHIDNVKFKLTLNGKDTGSSEQQTELAWEFTDKENKKKVFISSDNVSIEYIHYYGGFEELNEDINLIFGNLIEFYTVKISNRVGLRYINEIELDGSKFEWSSLLKPHIHNPTTEFIPQTDNVLRSMHLLDVKEEEFDLKFQFGMWNSEYPSPISRKEFVLDYDCILEKEIEISEIFPVSDELHKTVKKWFENSIDDGLREEMGII